MLIEYHQGFPFQRWCREVIAAIHHVLKLLGLAVWRTKSSDNHSDMPFVIELTWQCDIGCGIVILQYWLYTFRSASSSASPMVLSLLTTAAKPLVLQYIGYRFCIHSRSGTNIFRIHTHLHYTPCRAVESAGSSSISHHMHSNHCGGNYANGIIISALRGS